MIRFLSLRFSMVVLLEMALMTVVSLTSVAAQDVRIIVGNSTAKQGEHVAIEITGTIADASIDSMRVVIAYNANRLKIDSIIGGNEYAIRCQKPSFSDKVVILNGSLEVTCENIQSITDGKICILYCTVLAGLGTTAEISPKECYINGLKVDAFLGSGTITINDTPINVAFREGIGLPFENPSYNTIRIPYSIDSPTSVAFALYDILGRLVEDIPPIDRTQGFYEFAYLPRDGVFANGPYLVKMTTDQNVYFTYFMRLR